MESAHAFLRSSAGTMVTPIYLRPPAIGAPPRVLWPARKPSPGVCCGLRKEGPRKPLWRSAVISGEAIRAVQALKFSRKAPSPPSDPDACHRKLEEVLRNNVARLMKADLVAVLAELQRQNELELARLVFDFIQIEGLLELDLSLYSDMIYLAGKNNSVQVAEALFSRLKEKGLKLDSRVYTEMIGVYIQVGNLGKAMQLYNSMKESGCPPTQLTFLILLRYLQKLGNNPRFVSVLKKDCTEYLEYPDKFLEEVGKTHVRRKKIKIV